MKRIYLYIAILVKQTLFSGNVPVFSLKGSCRFFISCLLIPLKVVVVRPDFSHYVIAYR